MAPGWGLHAWLVVIAAALVAAAVLLATGADPAILFSPQGAPYVVLMVGTAAFALVPRGWARLVAGILVALVGVAALAFAAAALSRPQAVGDFAATVLLLLALLVGLPAAVRSFRASRRRRPEPPLRAALRDPHGRLVVALALVATGALAASVGSWDYARRSLDGASYDIAPEATAELRIASGSFQGALAMPSGRVVELAVANPEPALHTFTYVAHGVERSHDLLPFATTRFLLKLDEPGSVAYRCVPHSDGYARGMVGTLQVT